MNAWRPPGIKDPGGIPPGTYIARILDIHGFTSPRTGDYDIRIFFQCTTGESGPISLRFYKDDHLRTWVNGRNQQVINLLLSCANHVPPIGVEPNWRKVLTGLKDLQFQIIVKSTSSKANPYLVSLDLYDPEIDGPDLEGEGGEASPYTPDPTPQPPSKDEDEDIVLDA